MFKFENFLQFQGQMFITRCTKSQMSSFPDAVTITLWKWVFATKCFQHNWICGPQNSFVRKSYVLATISINKHFWPENMQHSGCGTYADKNEKLTETRKKFEQETTVAGSPRGLESETHDRFGLLKQELPTRTVELPALWLESAPEPFTPLKTLIKNVSYELVQILISVSIAPISIVPSGGFAQTTAEYQMEMCESVAMSCALSMWKILCIKLLSAFSLHVSAWSVSFVLRWIFKYLKDATCVYTGRSGCSRTN